MNERDKPIDLQIADEYSLKSKIGSGSFGEIFRGTCLSTGQDVAVKLEPKSSKLSQLEREAGVYKALHGAVGIPSVHHYSVEEEYNALVMDLLGPSLEDLFNYCRRKFSIKTVLMLAIQMLHRLEKVHSHHIISRDIKPDNFLMGLGDDSNTVFLIDYGLAKPWATSDGHHIDYAENKKMSGTVRYASINTHIGIVPTRRDDLEGLGYVLLYFLTGSLPWQGMKGATREFKYMRIAQSKIETPIKTLCHGYAEFEIYISYCRSLLHNQKPDYAFLRGLFVQMFNRYGYVYDYRWDWKTVAPPIPKKMPLSTTLSLQRSPHPLDIPHSSWTMESPAKGQKGPATPKSTRGNGTPKPAVIESKDLGWSDTAEKGGWGASNADAFEKGGWGGASSSWSTGWGSESTDKKDPRHHSAGFNTKAQSNQNNRLETSGGRGGWDGQEGSGWNSSEKEKSGWPDEETPWSTTVGWGDENTGRGEESAGWGAEASGWPGDTGWGEIISTGGGWGDDSVWGPAGLPEQEKQSLHKPTQTGKPHQLPTATQQLRVTISHSLAWQEPVSERGWCPPAVGSADRDMPARTQTRGGRTPQKYTDNRKSRAQKSFQPRK